MITVYITQGGVYKLRFSIIIPVYNMEKTLEKCVESVLKQNFNDYEIILINDGSSDDSDELCDFYKNKRRNIKVMHKNNEGLSMARNDGMKIADGEYIVFLDSDDWIGSGMLNDLNRVICDKSPDAICYDFSVSDGIHEFNKNKYQYIELTDTCISGEEALKRIWNFKLQCYSCMYCFKKSKLEDIEFMPGVYFEDILFTHKAFSHFQKIYLLNKKYYIYYQNETGITHNYSIKKAVDIFNHLEIIENELNSYIKLYEKEFCNYKLNLISFILTNYYRYINKYPNERNKEFERKVKTMFYRDQRKVRIHLIIKNPALIKILLINLHVFKFILKLKTIK